MTEWLTMISMRVNDNKPHDNKLAEQSGKCEDVSASTTLDVTAQGEVDQGYNMKWRLTWFPMASTTACVFMTIQPSMMSILTSYDINDHYNKFIIRIVT